MLPSYRMARLPGDELAMFIQKKFGGALGINLKSELFQISWAYMGLDFIDFFGTQWFALNAGCKRSGVRMQGSHAGQAVADECRGQQ